MTPTSFATYLASEGITWRHSFGDTETAQPHTRPCKMHLKQHSPVDRFLWTIAAGIDRRSTSVGFSLP